MNLTTKEIMAIKLARAFLITSTAIFVLSAPVTLRGVEPNTRTFTAGQKTKLQGTILSRDGATLKVRGDDDAIGTIDLTQETKIQLKKGGKRVRESYKEGRVNYKVARRS